MGETMKEQGSLSINSENLFPIIKKWLYSDHDIFVRELVSNGCDAITKLKKLEMMGEASLKEDEKLKVVDEWQKYRSQKLIEVFIPWCEENNIRYKRPQPQDALPFTRYSV